MPERQLVALTDSEGATAVVAPDLGAWLLQYARQTPKHGIVEALHCSQAVVDRYPREMYAGIPVLFPLVGNNRAGDKEHHYDWNGNLFKMPQHGFARRSKWAVREQSATSVTMELTETEASRADYPFAFRFCLTYRLNQGRLRWEQVIENRSDVPLPFSTGFHPYFAVPLTARSQREACFVEIPEAKRLVPVGRYERFTAEPFLAQNWSVDKDVAGTMFLTELKKQELILIDPVSELEVVFNFEEAPRHRFVAVWSKATSEPFYCLEPWTALPNSFSRQSKDHELILLEPQKTFRAAMWMELRPMA
jgi:galactose mutarotase-like enzyme